MVRVLRDVAPLKSARDVLAENGKRFHLFADSAEGRRSSMDRKVAAQRTAEAQKRVQKPTP